MAPFGYQWFSLQRRDEQSILSGVKKAAPILNNFIDTQLQRFSLTDDKVALLGFSQGTMMSLYTAPRRANNLAAIVGFSGALIGGELLRQDITAKPPTLLIHGDRDEVVPYSAMEHAVNHLKALSVPVEHFTCKGLGHNVNNDGIMLAIEFLQNNLNSSNK
jgi:phospholipase/carboxylesterase